MEGKKIASWRDLMLFQSAAPSRLRKLSAILDSTLGQGEDVYA